MKKKVLLITVMLVLALFGLVEAAFIVCDPPTVAEANTAGFGYKLFGLPNTSGTVPTEGISVPKSTESIYGFKYNIDYLPKAVYNVTAKACNILGCSDSSSVLNFSSIINKPSGLRIVAP